MNRKEQNSLINAIKTKKYAEAKKIVRGKNDWVIFVILTNRAIKLSHQNAKYKNIAEKLDKMKKEVRRGIRHSAVRAVSMLAKAR